MIIKLTYYGTNRPTLINLDNVESIYEVYDKTQGRFSTKVCFRGNDSYVNVEEDLKTLMKFYQEGLEGKHQPIDWETQTVDSMASESYYQQQSFRKPTGFKKPHSYNREGVYNDSRY